MRRLQTAPGSKPPWPPTFAKKNNSPNSRSGSSRPTTAVDTINHLGHCPLPNYEAVDRHPRGPEGDSLPGLSPPRRSAPGQRAVPRRRPDRRPARQAHAADRPRLRHEAGRIEVDDGETDYEALGQAKAIEFLEHIPDLRQCAGDRRAGRLRRRPGRARARRNHLLLSGPRSDHGLSPRARPVRAGQCRSSRG